MGKRILGVLLLFIATNGWWYCATQQSSVGETPIIIIPIAGSVGLLALIVGFIIDTWRD